MFCLFSTIIFVKVTFGGLYLNFEDLDSYETIVKMREEPDFNSIRSEILTLLANNKDMVLATSLNDRVSARTVSFVKEDFTIYFLSWEHNKKISQLRGNKNVAFTLLNLQIEGEAEILGCVYDGKFNAIGDLFRAKFSPKWYDTFSSIKEMVLVKVVTLSIVKFELIQRRLHLQNIDLKNSKVYQMRIEDKDNPHFPY